jgi:hypothetical protein
MDRLDSGIPLIDKAEDRKLGKGYIRRHKEDSNDYDKII